MPENASLSEGTALYGSGLFHFRQGSVGGSRALGWLIDAGLLLLNRSSSGQHGHNDLRWSIELHIVHHPCVLRAMH